MEENTEVESKKLSPAAPPEPKSPVAVTPVK
jgi:hypothetical protein